jgi:hypothetical protein
VPSVATVSGAWFLNSGKLRGCFRLGIFWVF